MADTPANGSALPPTRSPLKLSTAILEAQKLAWAPVAFAVTLAMRDRGVLAAIRKGGRTGRPVDEIVAETGLSEHAVKMMTEASISFGLVEQRERGYTITKVGYFILRDPMTRANMDFVRDVCFGGMQHFQEAVVTGKPAGLRVFGEFETIYDGLSQLPADVLKSWLSFDHFYSDGAFPEVLPILFSDAPSRLLDVGGNTGKFALSCARFDPDVRITIADHPGQLALAQRNAAEAGFGDRVDGYAIDVLDPAQQFPRGHDIIWMSQFLVCFSEPEIVSILERARAAMGRDTQLWILETFWDKQENDVATYCLHGMSPYFTCMANGNSRVYSDPDFLGCIQRAGLKVVYRRDELGHGHTLLRCARA
ncbi:MAG: SAM-dependent methyltransferase [Myxococcales bacterium]|nr:SAM-dependent methyltransferase [Myxococcales bacterium]MCB9753668.1 SAM-dependent methyltransferase [Myxococcales bacterium]